MVCDKDACLGVGNKGTVLSLGNKDIWLGLETKIHG